MDHHLFAAGGLSARVNAHGAELASLAADGLELVWQAGAPWKRHAPILFPIVGRLGNDTLVHEGRSYPMTQHGFARDLPWAWLHRTGTGCGLRLEANHQTLASYPFRFRLDVHYTLRSGALHIDFELANPGDDTLPASLGTHTAFNWPLVPDTDKSAYRIRFAAEEPGPIRKLSNGLLLPGSFPTPIEGSILPLSEHLFAEDALILERPASRSATLETPNGRGVLLEWTNFPQLGIWSKPADFVCIEPWHGTSSPAAFEGEFRHKPHLMLLAPGTRQEFSLTIASQGRCP